MKLLLIEDNETIKEGIIYSCEANGYTVKSAKNIKTALEILKNETFDLIILDIMLPDGNGITFFKQHIKPTNIKVLFLTAIDDEEIITEAFENGCTEYITKPFSLKELSVKIKRILNKKNIIKIKNIEYNIDKMELTKNGNKINLTSLETKIINLLFININKTVSRNVLLDEIWEYTGNDVDDHTITVYLKRIREKIDDDIIKTIKGIGYRIDE